MQHDRPTAVRQVVINNPPLGVLNQEVRRELESFFLDAQADGGCGGNLGLGYAVSPRLARYSRGLSEPREILIRFSLYQ